MRKVAALPGGDWFHVVNKKDSEPTKVYIYDEIGFWGTEASEFVKAIAGIKDDAFELHLNSPGGEIFDGLAIYNSIRQHSAEVTVFVDGLAASAASFIAQAGDKVVMARNAQLMIHDGIAFAYGNEQDMLDTADLLSQLSNNIADIYAEAAKRRGNETDLEGFRNLMRAEVWYNGQEAVDAGLADAVLDTEDEETEKASKDAKNKWDLGLFNHAGRERAESPSRIAARLQLTNQAKEKDVPPEDENKETPAGDGTPTGDTDEPGTTVVPDDSGVQPPTEAVTADQPETAAPQPTANAAQQGVMINGRLETDYNVIARHFNTLETAQRETTQVNRQRFIEGLAASNKIGAAQIDSLVALVNGSEDRPGFTDEQFTAFQASYESAPASSLFDKHATQQEAPQFGGPTAPVNREQKIKDLEGIIAMHQRGGLPEEDIKKTKSYIELQQLLGDNS